MKKYTILFIVFLSFTISGKHLFSQRLEGKSVLVFNYSFFMDEELENALSSFTDKFTNPHHGDNKLKGAFVHISYGTLKEKLESDLEIMLLPPNSLGKKATYNEYGYPIVTIQKAINKSDYKIFAKIKISMSSSFTENEDEILPTVKVEVDFFNEHGYVAYKSGKGTATASSPLKLEEGVLEEFSRNVERSEDTSETIMDLLVAAIEDIYEQL